MASRIAQPAELTARVWTWSVVRALFAAFAWGSILTAALLAADVVADGYDVLGHAETVGVIGGFLSFPAFLLFVRSANPLVRALRALFVSANVAYVAWILVRQSDRTSEAVATAFVVLPALVAAMMFSFPPPSPRAIRPPERLYPEPAPRTAKARRS